MKSRLAAHWQILSALVLATLTALTLRLMVGTGSMGVGLENFVGVVVSVCGFVGELFMRALQMLIVPLIVTSVVAGISGLKGVKGFGRLGIRTMAFYVGSSLLAILLGLALVNLIRPGLENGKPNATIAQAFEQARGKADAATLARVEAASARDSGSMLEVLRSMLPENVFAAASQNGQMLGVLVFSILFGIALAKLPGDRVQAARLVFQDGADAMVMVTGWIMSLAPVGVYALILPVVYVTGAELFVNLGKYFVTVMAGLAIHFLVVLPLLLILLGKVNPWAHFRAMRPALMLAFSSASSSATLPVTMRCVEQGAGVSKRVSSFTLPLGATVNMDGTALYECVAVMFVAQVLGVELGFASQLFIVVAALLTSIGVAGVPSASLVAILIILKSVHIPGAENACIALLAVDRLLDMSRTAVNVYSDTCAAVIIAKAEDGRAENG